ncbi:mitochondrial thiamine pyrophosphate carrier 1 [Diplogelasinospora grovesii]|uniref:Mitochondrial thiamine pyrophosphate carrier 1 n=1 Tax=Diplogelasinospora grovesii TaxID=303347 RepID=A0AAN6S5T5_9PEZI|nr:mitochondrial thiamine pyrophosphate carrier 1 [Diplogelasinospora grovesii]
MSGGKSERLKDEGSSLQVTAAGATAGLISRFVIAPLDVVKIRLQLQTHSLSDPLSVRDIRGSPVYKGTIPTMRYIVRHEGLRALWKGNVPAELMYICYSAVQFRTYRSTTLLLHRMFASGGEVDDGKGGGKPPTSKLPHSAESFIAGATAGAVATAATYPLDLLRTRFAAQGNDDRVYANLRRAIVQIAQEEGFRGYFRGLGPGLGQIVPYMGIFFAAYETLRLPLGKMEMPFSSGDAAAGILASVMAKTATFPLDLVRKRIQVQGPNRCRYVHKNIPEYSSGTAGTIRTILRNEGVRGLYRGLTVSLFKAAPASAVTMWTYERALRFYITLGEQAERKL